MRAVMLDRFGPPDVLAVREVPDPTPGRGEVMIDVELANITFVETQIRNGTPPHPAMLPELPAILGNGVGGVIAAIGPGVDERVLGGRVVTSLRGTGGYAERAVASADRLVDVPEQVTMRDAVALLADGRTALMLIGMAPPPPGGTVLVEAAAGGVGSLLVQLARNAGARVVAVAGGHRKVSVARELGADVAIDYLDAHWATQAREAVGGVDVVFDGVGGAVGRAAFDLLRPEGRFSPFGMASGSAAPVSAREAGERGVTIVRGGTSEPGELVELSRAAIRQAATGELRPLIGQEYALDDAAAAHTAIEQRATFGKTLLVVG